MKAIVNGVHGVLAAAVLLLTACSTHTLVPPPSSQHSPHGEPGKPPASPPSAPAPSCNLTPIDYGVIRKSLVYQPPIGNEELRLNPKFAFTTTGETITAPDGTVRRLVRVSESNEISFLKTGFFAGIAALYQATLRQNLGENCNHSIEGFSISAMETTPPSFDVRMSTRVRACGYVDVPCGLPETTCEIRLDYQKCETHTPMCRQTAVQDLYSADFHANLVMSVTKNSEGSSLSFPSVLGSSQLDTGGGDVYNAVTAIGLSKLLIQNVGDQVIGAGFSKMGEIFPALSFPQADALYQPTIESAQWGAAQTLPGESLMPFGIKVERVQKLQEGAACFLARCLRSHSGTGAWPTSCS